MARKRTPSPETPTTKPSSPWRTAGAILVVLAGFASIAFGARWLALHAAPLVFLVADGDHRRVVAILLTLWALAPVVVLAGVRLQLRHGRWAGAPCWVAVVGLVLLLFGFLPGKGDDGRLGRQLNAAVDGSSLTDVGEVFIGSALAAIACFIVVAPVTAWWMRLGESDSRRTTARTVSGAVGYVGAWVAAGAMVLSIIGSGPGARIGWLEQTADVLRGGDAGVTGEFQVGLDASVLDVVDCDAAADRLRVDGRTPDLDGCRRALLVAAEGRYDREGTRVSSGRLVAVVVQVRNQGQLDDLDAALSGAEILAGGGLPEPRGAVLTTQAPAALSLVVAAEDTGDIPLPAEGAGRRPISRALAYVLIGTAVGLYVSPPEEEPAP